MGKGYKAILEQFEKFSSQQTERTDVGCSAFQTHIYIFTTSFQYSFSCPANTLWLCSDCDSGGTNRRTHTLPVALLIQINAAW